MKKLITTGLMLATAGTLIITSCKKDVEGCTDSAANNYNAEATIDNGSCTFENTIPVASTPSAKSENDNTSGGVYKGTFVGSSGVFQLFLENDNIYGELIVDGNYYLLNSSLTNNDLSQDINQALFTDDNNTVRLTFSVNADGSNPVVSLEIDGHANVSAVVVKELSGDQAKVYEGTANMASGTWTVNLVIRDNDTTAYSSIIYPDNSKFSNDYSWFVQQDTTGNTTAQIYRWVYNDTDPNDTIPGEWVQDEWVEDFGLAVPVNVNDSQISASSGSDNITLTRKI